MQAAVNEWRDRWPNPKPFEEGDDDRASVMPESGEDQVAWHLARGFDGIAEWLGGM